MSVPFWKGMYTKRKEFAPKAIVKMSRGANSFLLEYTAFQKKSKKNLTFAFSESVSVPYNVLQLNLS